MNKAVLLISLLFLQETIAQYDIPDDVDDGDYGEEGCPSVPTCSACLLADGCQWSLNKMSCVSPDTIVETHDRRITHHRDCLGVMMNGFNYEDAFGRRRVLPLVAAPHSTDPLRCLKNAGFSSGIKLMHETTANCDGNYSCSAYLFDYHIGERAIVLTFSGPKDIAGTFTANSTMFEELKMIYDDQPRLGKVGAFYLDVFAKMWDEKMAYVINNLATLHPDHKIWVTGHGIGGGFASLAAVRLMQQLDMPPSRIRLVTMGQPMLGDVTFAVAHSGKFPYSYRITTKQDQVPHLPKIDGYYHANYETAYDSSNATAEEYSVCLADKGCYPLPNGTESPNSDYFGQDIYEYAQRLCTRLPA